jgi:hypothetical protein
MQYRCEATSVEGFIQQLAVQYVAHGYWYFVTGRVPPTKDPAAVDRKLLERYGIERSKWSRARQKQGGRANLHYLRYQDFFVLLATEGAHQFFDAERGQVKDLRRTWLKAFSYEVGFRNGHALVRIERGEYRRVKSYFLEVGIHRSATELADRIFRLGYVPYQPVYRQVRRMVWDLNRARKRAGYEPVSLSCVRRLRKVVRPFEVQGLEDAA